VGLDAWLEASHSEPRVFGLMSLQQMMEQMRQVTIVRGSKKALPFHKFLKGACFLAEDSEQVPGDFTEFVATLDELSFSREKGSSDVTLTKLIEKTFAIEGAAGMRANHDTKEPELSCRSVNGVWELDPDDPKLMTVKFDGGVVLQRSWTGSIKRMYSFVINMERQQLVLFEESGVKLVRGKESSWRHELERGTVFHLQGTSKMGINPMLPTLMDQWSKSKELTSLPSAEIAIVKQNNREKLKAFVKDRI